jgi:nicotinate-nucleotide adenylyltransferase
MKKIGIMGGTFDPIHNGHLITATFIKENYDFDKILFIPCYISPLKTDINSSSSLHRLNMLKLAIEGVSYFDYSDIELQNPEISFTYNTLLKLNGDGLKLNLIIGFDNYVVFDKWYNPEGILELADIFVLNRNNDKSKVEIKHKYKEYFNFINNPLIEISSTEIRNRVNEGKDITYLVPNKVRDYILMNNLYR